MEKFSVAPFNRLVRLAARAFYNDITPKSEKENQPKTTGIAVVVLDALTKRQWAKEEDLAKALKLQSRQLRRILRFLEEERLIRRGHRKETAAGDGGRKGGQIHSYCCLDYAQMYDVLRYRLHQMKSKLKDQMPENKKTIQEYKCMNCGKRYDSLEANRLVSMVDGNFHCEACNGELEEIEKQAAQEIMGGDEGNDKATRWRKIEELLKKMDEQLKPLMDQINLVKDLAVPEFGSLQEWEASQAKSCAADGEENGDIVNENDSYASRMTKVEVALPESDNPPAPKVFPPWLMKQGMSLTKEHRGHVYSTYYEDDEKKSEIENHDKKEVKMDFQDEYFKAYYAAILERQRELQEDANIKEEILPNSGVSDCVAHSSSIEKQVGINTKGGGDDDDDDDDDVEWEEA